MKAPLRVLAFILSLVLCVGLLSGCAGSGGPLSYLKERVKQTLSESLGGELVSFLSEALQNGSVHLDFGGTDLVQGLPESAELQLWMDVEQEKLAADAKMTLAGKEYEGAFWVNSQSAVLTSPTFLGSHNVGVDFETLKKDLETSIFANTGSTEFARPNVTPATADSVTAFKDAVFQLLASVDGTEELFEQALDCFLEKLTENATNTRYKEDGRTYVTLSVDNDALSRSLRETRADLVKDRAFCRELRELAKTMDAIRTAEDGVVSNDYSTKLEYFLTSETDIDTVCLAIDSAPAFTFDLKGRVKNFGGKLEKLELSHTVAGVEVLSAELYLANSEDVSYLSVTYLGITRKLTYQCTKDSFRHFNAEMLYTKSFGGLDLLDVRMELSADRRDKSFTATLEKGAISRSFSGTYRFDDSAFALDITDATLGGESKRFLFTLEVSKGTAMPKAPEYVNLASISYNQFKPMAERALAAGEALEAAVAANALSPYTVFCDLLLILGAEEEIPPLPQE